MEAKNIPQRYRAALVAAAVTSRYYCRRASVTVAVGVVMGGLGISGGGSCGRGGADGTLEGSTKSQDKGERLLITALLATYLQDVAGER